MQWEGVVRTAASGLDPLFFGGDSMVLEAALFQSREARDFKHSAAGTTAGGSCSKPRGLQGRRLEGLLGTEKRQFADNIFKYL
jgi:hypothetical protein